jgi:NAD(P)-dependent dehydrogenase (short-subunit alcohol dehydrogenase family)
MPNNKWTTNDIPDLKGKVIIVTGANIGIGYETAKEVARKGAQTILACRSMEKAQTALDQIRGEIPDVTTEIMQLDLASQKSVHNFAKNFKAKYNHLDILINNAGISRAPYEVTEDGFEKHFGVNHLGHFALTGLLIDLLLKTSESRVVIVGSLAHRSANMNFDNLMCEGGRGYNDARAYGQSKLANMIFAYELQRRLEATSANTISVAAHPGGSNTNIFHHQERKWFDRLILVPILKRIGQSAAMGALPSLRAAVDPEVKGGEYYGPDGFLNAVGYPVLEQSSEAAHNLEDARKLWEVSEKLTGVHYKLNY